MGEKDKKLLSDICETIGKERFIKLMEIVSDKCINDLGGRIECADSCGECFYNFIVKYDNKNNQIS